MFCKGAACDDPQLAPTESAIGTSFNDMKKGELLRGEFIKLVEDYSD